MTTEHTVPGAAAALVALALVLAPALAVLPAAAQQPGPGDDPDQARQDGNESGDRDANRSENSASGQQAERSERRGGPEDRPGADPVTIEDRPGGFATRAPEGSPRPTVAVDASAARAEVQREDVHPLSMRLDALVAYLDEDGDGAYDLGEPVVERVGLRDVSSRIVADDANDTRSLVYELPRDGQVEIVFDVGADHGEEVAAKVDVVVEGYAAPDPDARIALGARVEAPGGVEAVELGDTPALAGTSGEDVAYLSWAPVVEVDGQAREVGASVHVSATPDEAASDGDATVYWSYPQGDRVVHDPTLGVTDAVRDLPGKASAFLIGLAATLVVLGAGYVARRRVPL